MMVYSPELPGQAVDGHKPTSIMTKHGDPSPQPVQKNHLTFNMLNANPADTQITDTCHTFLRVLI